MSRRSHHPIRRHVRPRHPEGKRGAPGPEHAEAVAETELASDALSAPEPPVPDEPTDAPTDEPVEEPAAEVSEEPPGAPAEGPVEAPAIEPPEAPAPPAIANEPSAPHATGVVTGIVAPAMPAGPSGPAVSPGPPGAATAPQLRRFIKSRSYIPMHELRRRFGIVVEDDDVAAIDLGGHRVYVGLPPREGALLGELLRAGDVGYEASFDPVAPIIVGVFPIRPVTRG